MNIITSKIKHAANLALIWNLFTAFISVLLIWTFLFCLFTFWDHWSPLQERLLLFALSATSLLVFIYFVASIISVFMKKPSSLSIALKIEEAHPHLYDVLNCAVEFLERKDKQLNEFEQLVVEQASGKTEAINFSKSTNPSLKHLLKNGTLFILLCFALWSLTKESAFIKSVAAYHDLKSGQVTGISVIPGSGEFAAKSDITIQAIIHRGENRAEIEFLSDDSKESEWGEMQKTDKGLEYIFYDVYAPFKYRIKTPSLTSQWSSISLYTPLEITSTEWKITPPGYTNLPQVNYSGFDSIKVPEDSNAVANVRVIPPDSTVELLSGKYVKLLKKTDAIYEDQWKIDQSDTYRLRVKDEKAHTMISEGITIDIIPDENPIVEITDPANDITAEKDEILLIEIFVTDDYGLSASTLNLSIGGKKSGFPLDISKNEKEKEIVYALKLKELGVKVGAVLSYYVQVTDNKAPAGQQSQSDIYFIEIKPEAEEKPENKKGQDGPKGKQKELPIRQLIVETKRIMRGIHKALSQEKQDQNLAVNMIRSDAESLEKALAELYSENKASLGALKGVDTRALVKESVTHMEKVVQHLSKNSLPEALYDTEKSLEKLVTLYYLIKETQQQMSSDSSGESEETTESDKPSEKKREASSENSIVEKMTKMNNALELTKKLAKQQKDLNSQISRSARKGQKASFDNALTKQQGDISQQAKDIYRDIYKSTGKLSMVNSLQKAYNEMDKSFDRLQKDAFSKAYPHGIRAEEALDIASSVFKSNLYELADQLLQELSNKSNRIAKRQKNTSKKTGQGQPGEADPLMERQQEHNKSISKLLSEMESAASLLSQTSKKAANDLVSTSREVGKNGIKESGQRAVNALLYEAFDSAKAEQEKVSRQLGKIKKGIKAAHGAILNESDRSVANLIKDIAETREGLNKMQKKDIQKIAESMGKKLNDHIEKDPRLKENVKRLNDIREGEGDYTMASETDWLLKRSSQILMGILWQKQNKKRIGRNRQMSTPPKKYREQIEEYFRKLAEHQ